jgi:hypothetical protein
LLVGVHLQLQLGQLHLERRILFGGLVLRDLVVVLRLGLNLRGAGVFGAKNLLVQLLLQRGAGELDQKIPFVDRRPVADQPIDRRAVDAVAADVVHLADDLDVLLALQRSPLDNRDGKVGPSRGVEHQVLVAGVHAGGQNRREDGRRHADHRDGRNQPAPLQPLPGRPRRRRVMLRGVPLIGFVPMRRQNGLEQSRIVPGLDRAAHEV